MKNGRINLKTILVTHSRIYSASQALRDYLRKNNNSYLLYISHPLLLKGDITLERSFSEISYGKKIINHVDASIRVNNLLFSSFIETLLTIWWVLKTHQKFDFYIGVDNLNALAGLFLKFFGRVDKVVYYTIDYFPTRFSNQWLNKIYHAIDKYCVKYTDETWNVSPVMAEARRKNGMNGKRYEHQYTTPIGIWYDRAPRRSLAKINKYKLIFVGHLVPHMGVDLIIRSMPEIIKKIPQVSLDIIGGGQELDSLKKLAEDLKLGKKVYFYGWIENREKLEKIMASGAIGLAPFNTQILDDKVKNADPGKIKDYMLMGMPVIVTNAIAFGEDIKKHKCGIVIQYKKKELILAIQRLITNKKLFQMYRRNALAYVSQFDYNMIFDKALSRLIHKNEIKT